MDVAISYIYLAWVFAFNFAKVRISWQTNLSPVEMWLGQVKYKLLRISASKLSRHSVTEHKPTLFLLLDLLDSP